MPSVTALRATRSGAIALHADGSFVCSVSEALVARWHLFAGRDLTDQDLAEIQTQASGERVVGDAYRLLGHRVRSRAELKRRLIEKGHPEAVAEATVERLEGERLIDDAAFATAFINDKRRQLGWGRTRLVRELGRLGVSAAVIEASLGEPDDHDEAARALAILTRKGRPKAPLEASKRRAYQMLLRRGFSHAVVYAAIRRWVAENEPDSRAGHIDATDE